MTTELDDLPLCPHTRVEIHRVCTDCGSALPDVLEPLPQLPSGDDYDEYGAPYQTLKDARQSRALRAVLNGATITNACKAAGVQIGTWYRWKSEDQEFRRMYERALQHVAEEIEPDAMARAKESDALAMFFLKAWNPARYRDRQVIEVVSPDVQTRLAQQADAIIATCKEFLEPEVASKMSSRLAHRLREIWTTEDDRKRIGA